MNERPSYFPSPESSDDPDGVIGYSRRIYPGMLLDAYSRAIFPWPYDENEIVWVSPPQRGILRFSELHIPARLKRFLKNRDWTFEIDRDFKSVIEACATAKRQDEGTWITSAILTSFQDFHRKGYAHSFEVYRRNGDLIGGMYGVGFDRFFGGESMFFRETGASKFALLAAIATLRNLGIEWIDSQMVTPILGAFGAKNIERSAFLTLFRASVRNVVPISSQSLRDHIGRPEDLF